MALCIPKFSILIMSTIVIEVSGGVVQQVYASERDVRVVLVDWDRMECNEPAAVPYPADSLGDIPPETKVAARSLLE